MILTIYRSRVRFYKNGYAFIDEIDWTFDAAGPSAGLVPTNIGDALFVRSDPSPLVVKTPHLASFVERTVVGADGRERPDRRLSFPGDTWGIDATSIATLALAKGRGFSIAERSDDEVAKRNDQPSLFGDPEPTHVGAYGRRPTRPDPVTPVVEAMKAHQEEASRQAAVGDARRTAFETWVTADLVARAEEAGRAISEIEKSRPKGERGQSRTAILWRMELADIREILADRGITVQPASNFDRPGPDWSPVKTIPTLDGERTLGEPATPTGPPVIQTEGAFRRSGESPATTTTRPVIETEEEFRRRGGRRVRAATPSNADVPAHVAEREAGADLVVDVDRAIAFILDGRGIVAIRILEKARETIVAKGEGL